MVRALDCLTRRGLLTMLKVRPPHSRLAVHGQASMTIPQRLAWSWNPHSDILQACFANWQTGMVSMVKIMVPEYSPWVQSQRSEILTERARTGHSPNEEKRDETCPGSCQAHLPEVNLGLTRSGMFTRYWGVLCRLQGPYWLQGRLRASFQATPKLPELWQLPTVASKT